VVDVLIDEFYIVYSFKILGVKKSANNRLLSQRGYI
jgi:hypothetical protein